MKSRTKLSYIILALIFCISICTIKVMAVGEDEEVVVTEAPVVTAAPTQAVTEAPVVTAAPTQAATKAPVTTKATTAYVAPTTKAQVNSYVAPATSAYNNYATSANNYATSANNYATSATSATSAGSASKSEVYDVEDEEVDEDTLKKSDWKDIAERLSTADDDDDSDPDSFDFIKNNDGTNDNGQWILYTGIGMEIAAGLIIVILIVLAVRRKKKLKQAKRTGSAPTNHGHEGQPRQQRPSSDKPAQRQQHTPTQSHGASSRQVRRRSKYDTDEIQLTKQRKSSGGRYKPKH
jgi:hypothetical protein